MIKSNKITLVRELLSYWEKTYTRMVLTVASAAIVYPSTAHAYIDPGSGSVVLSTLLGLAAAVAYTSKKYFYKIRRFFSKKDAARDHPATGTADKD